MAVTTFNSPFLTHMPARRTAVFSPLTLVAVLLTLSGLLIGTLDVRWSLQLISLGCVYSGGALAGLALLVHLVRRNVAWAADGGLLLCLGALMFSSPMLPATMQDYLEYLMP